MNKVILLGNLTSDPVLKTSQSGVPICSFRIAVRRNYKNASGEYESDFLQCTAFKGTAEFINNHFTKGRKILVSGSIQTRTWDKDDGSKGYATEIVVDGVEFADSKPDGQPKQAAPQTPIQESLIPVDDDDQLPF